MKAYKIEFFNLDDLIKDFLSMVSVLSRFIVSTYIYKGKNSICRNYERELKW